MGTPQPVPILLVDDDAGIRRAVTRALEVAEFAVTAVADRAGALDALARDGQFGLAILDVNLPDANGLDLCEEIRDRFDLPVIMLTVVGDEADIVRALERGADDYIRKPFSARELAARVQSVLRRTRATDGGTPVVRAGPLELDAANYRVLVEGKRAPLTPTEFRLLSYLAQHAARVVPHDQLLSAVWGAGYEGEHHMLHVTVSRLRQKLQRLTAQSLIRTVPGVGYEFVAG